MRFDWIKVAISGATYARALSNAAGRAGRNIDALQPGLNAIAGQAQAKLKPGLSSMMREPGALPMTPQRQQMQDFAHRMPWAGEEHAHPVESATAVGTLNSLIKRRGLEHGSAANAPALQSRIDQSFGNPEQFRRELYSKDRPVAAPVAAPSTQAGRPGGMVGRVSAPRPSGNVLSPHARTFNGVQPAPPAPSYGAGAGGVTRVLRKTANAGALAAGIGIPLALGGGMLLNKPGIQSNLKNLVGNSGSTQEQDTAGELHPMAVGHAEKIHQALTARGIDPATLRMGIDAPPGSGKTTLARAVAQRSGMKHHGLDWEPGNWWKSTIGLGRNVESMPRAPKAGEILEHYMLGRTYDPEVFDAMVHIKRDPELLKQQLTARGNGAYIGTMMDLHKSLGVAAKGFDTLGGDMIDIGDGVQLKLRPREGWGNNLDQQLMQAGINPEGMTRHDKLLSLHEGKKSSGSGWTPYVKNPFSTGESLALAGSVPLGIMAAKALMKRPIPVG